MHTRSAMVRQKCIAVLHEPVRYAPFTVSAAAAGKRLSYKYRYIIRLSRKWFARRLMSMICVRHRMKWTANSWVSPTSHAYNKFSIRSSRCTATVQRVV